MADRFDSLAKTFIGERYTFASPFADQNAKLLADLLRRVDREAVERCAKIAEPAVTKRKGRVGLWRKRRIKLAAEIRDTIKE